MTDPWRRSEAELSAQSPFSEVLRAAMDDPDFFVNPEAAIDLSGWRDIDYLEGIDHPFFLLMRSVVVRTRAGDLEVFITETDPSSVVLDCGGEAVAVAYILATAGGDVQSWLCVGTADSGEEVVARPRDDEFALEGLPQVVEELGVDSGGNPGNVSQDAWARFLKAALLEKKVVPVYDSGKAPHSDSASPSEAIVVFLLRQFLQRSNQTTAEKVGLFFEKAEWVITSPRRKPSLWERILP